MSWANSSLNRFEEKIYPKDKYLFIFLDLRVMDKGDSIKKEKKKNKGGKVNTIVEVEALTFY